MTAPEIGTPTVLGNDDVVTIMSALSYMADDCEERAERREQQGADPSSWRSRADRCHRLYERLMGSKDVTLTPWGGDR